MPHTARIAESAVVEHAVDRHVVQPVPQPGGRGYGTRPGSGFCDGDAMHQLPHHDSRIEPESGVYQVRVMELSRSGLLERGTSEFPHEQGTQVRALR